MKMSYVYDRHIFHYIVEDGLVFMTMADEEFGRRVPFSFLADIKNRFKSSYGDRAKTALAYGMNEDFSRVLEKQMVRRERREKPGPRGSADREGRP